MGPELSLESQIEVPRSGYDRLDIGDPLLDSTSQYGRYSSAIYSLGESFEKYRTKIAFISGDDSFTSSRDLGDKNIRWISIRLINREIESEVKWGNNKLLVRKDGLILNDGVSWIEFDGKNLFPLIFEQKLISKVSKDGVELGNLDNKERETFTVPHDSLIEVLKIIKTGLDHASDLLQNYIDRKKESKNRVFFNALRNKIS